MDVVELVACWIPLKMNASSEAENSVSGNLPYATTVTWSVHTPMYPTWLFQSIRRRSSMFYPVGVSVATLLPLSSWCSFRELIFQTLWLKCVCPRRSACPSILSKTYLISNLFPVDRPFVVHVISCGVWVDGSVSCACELAVRVSWPCVWAARACVWLQHCLPSKKMDGIWNRYNLKSTRRIYTFCA